VREHDRVVVDIDDTRLRCDGLRDLVHVTRRGQTGPDVDELADTHLADEVPDDAPQDGALVRALRDGPLEAPA
jgi:hypothetical protein